MNKEIFLIRHGETDYNRRKLVQGSGIDAGLNELGIAQAMAFYECYKTPGFDAVYVSALKRARQSIDQFVSDGTPVYIHPGLNEISWGKFEGQNITSDNKKYFSALFERWSDGETGMAIEGGESPLEVAIRMSPVLESIKYRPEKRILVCMHGRAMRIFLCMVTGKELSEMEKFNHHNLGLYHLRQNHSDFDILRSNCIEHLATQGLFTSVR